MSSLTDIKAAIVHDRLTEYGGSERVVEALCELLPSAQLFTPLLDESKVPRLLRDRVVSSGRQKGARLLTSHYRCLLPLLALALERLDLREFDLVVSSSHAFANFVLTRPDALHICYCYTPPRYLWDLYQDYIALGAFPRPVRMLVPLIAPALRCWDAVAASRVDHFVAVSTAIKHRIRKHYRQPAEVVFPPVRTDYFTPMGEPDDYYLVVSRLEPYKRVELAIQAFNELGLPLRVIGTGSAHRRLMRLVGSTVQMLGWQPDHVVREHYRRCRAFIFPGEEDFGITMVEAQACGRPVIAYRRGGAVDIVEPEVTGVLFQKPTDEALAAAVRRSRGLGFDSARISRRAGRFSGDAFQQRMRSLILRLLARPAGSPGLTAVGPPEAR